MAQNDVKFIRVNGRVVPIRQKKDQPNKAAAIGAAAGATTGVTASLVSPVREEFALRKAQVMKSPSAFRKKIRAGDVLLFESKDLKGIEAVLPQITQGTRFIHTSVAVNKSQEALMDLMGGKTRKITSGATQAQYADEVALLRPKSDAVAKRGAQRARRFVRGKEYDLFRSVPAGFFSRLKKPKCKGAICHDVPSNAYREAFKGYVGPSEMLKSDQFEVVARLRRNKPSRLAQGLRYGVRPTIFGAALGAAGYGIGKLLGRRQEE